MVHTILTFGMILGVVLMGLGFLTARTVLEASGTPESVINEALLYIRIYFIGIPFMTIYNFGAAISQKLRRHQKTDVLSGIVRNRQCSF